MSIRALATRASSLVLRPSGSVPGASGVGRRASSFLRASCLVLALAVRAEAQPLPSPSTAPPAADFMAHYNFQLSLTALAIDDERFSWSSHFGGDIDLVDYVAGRANVVIDYEAVLGREFRPFDPNQGNYTLEASASARAGRTEIAGLFHHVSRHMSDRPKRFPIAWNAIGVRVLRRTALAGATVDGQASLSAVIRRSYVDYLWTGNIDVVARRSINPRVGVFGHGYGELYRVDAAVANRGPQAGGNLEAGVRLRGRGGAVEFFAGYERRIDADPVTREAQRWATIGFRFLAP